MNDDWDPKQKSPKAYRLLVEELVSLIEEFAKIESSLWLANRAARERLQALLHQVKGGAGFFSLNAVYENVSLLEEKVSALNGKCVDAESCEAKKIRELFSQLEALVKQLV